MPYYPRIPPACFVGNYAPSSLLLDWGATGTGGYVDPYNGNYVSDIPGAVVGGLQPLVPLVPGFEPVSPLVPGLDPVRPQRPQRPEPPRPSSVPSATLRQPPRPRPANPSEPPAAVMTLGELRFLADNADALLGAVHLAPRLPGWVDYKLRRATQRLRDVAFAVTYGSVPKAANPPPEGHMTRQALGKIEHNAKYLLEVLTATTELMEWQTAYITEAQIDVQDVVDYVETSGSRAENPRRLAGAIPKTTGLFCPKGQYLYCKGPKGCRCVTGARAWKWWEKRPSPLWPNPATSAAEHRPEAEPNPWGLDMGRGATGPLWSDYERMRQRETQLVPSAFRHLPTHAPRIANPGSCPQGSVFAGSVPGPNNAGMALCTDPKTGKVVSTVGTVRTYPYQHMGFYGYHGS